MAWDVIPIFVCGFVARNGSAVLTITISNLAVIGLILSPLGEVPSVAVSPLPIVLFYLV